MWARELEVEAKKFKTSGGMKCLLFALLLLFAVAATTFPPLQVADGGGTLSQPGLVAMVPQAQANGRDCEEGELYQFSSDKIETALSCCKRKKNSRCNYATHLLACQYLNQTAVCPTVQVYVASSQSARVSSMPSKRKYSLLSP